MGRFGMLFGKDLKIIGRNRTLVVTLILYPLLMVTILGLVFADPDQPIPVGIVIGDEGNAPLEIEEDVTVSLDMVEQEIDRFAHVERFRDQDAAKDALRNGRVDAVLVFPDFFLADVVLDFSDQAELLVILDRSDMAKSMVAENIIRASVQQFNEQVVEFKVRTVVDLLETALEGDVPSDMSFRNMLVLLQDLREDPDLPPEHRARIDRAIDFLEATIVELEGSSGTVQSIALPIETNVTHVVSGVLSAHDIVVPAAVALSIFWTGILASASLVVYERESHAQVRLNVSPVGMPAIVASKLTLTAGIIMLQSLLIVAVAKLFWNVRIDSPELLLMVMLAGVFSAVGLGLFVAGLARDMNGTTLLSVLAIFPMMFLSGLFFPVSFMPQAAQVIARLIPLTYAVDGLRGAMLRNYTFADIQLDLVVLILLGALTISIGYVRNKQLSRRV